VYSDSVLVIIQVNNTMNNCFGTSGMERSWLASSTVAFINCPVILMRYGFVIDQDRCIGCHACTVACKEENQVPVGVFRTWVKYVEKGAFPHTSRHFGVLRCNHCDDAPCIEICPTSALFRRENGIVDFDNNRCIGCKGCMQACPYDALFIDPQTNTAAKCHYCAHRVERNLEPACVIVCPTRAIIPGDLDEPSSHISRLVAQQKVTVRKPQKGTNPKLFYIGVDGDLITPTRLQQQSTYVWSDRRDDDASIASIGASNWSGWARETYDAPHTTPWGWKIAAYLWTKSIAAGAILFPAVALSTFPSSPALRVAAPVIGLVILAVTLLLLVLDLKRPDRFFYLLTKANRRSWLVIGSYILMAYGAALLAWLYFGIRGPSVPLALRVIAFLLSLGSAGYSAFLFAQAKGRDLWQSPTFFWHLLVHAAVAGTAALLLTNVIIQMNHAVTFSLSVVLGIALVVSLAMQLAEVALPHVNEDVRLAIHEIVAGRFRARYWGLAIGVGLLLPVVLIALSLAGATSFWVAPTAALLALAGIWWFEEIWIKAGQAVPLS
jgi:Fe-S-cluster-containing dehydrogenase component/formate-dependent nitrite reductase membrane component NrfD